MATVYKAYQADVDRYVAVKVLPPHPGRDPQFTDRFRREAATVARLQHPHILPLYDFGEQDGTLYLVTALIPGGTLSDRIRRGPLPLHEVERLLMQMAPALDYAHRNNVIHRDIKPDNILLDSEGYALLTDFGIAKLAETESRMTLTGSLVGTPAYMSPEQAQGLPAEPRSDIYSLGIVIYEMLTGRQPFTAETPMQVLIKHMNEPLPPISAVVPGLPPALDAVLQQALTKSPERRYASAVAFAEDFARAVRGQSPMLGNVAEDFKSTIQFERATTPAPGTTTPPPYPTQYPTQYPYATPPPTTTQTVVAAPGSNWLVAVAGSVIVVLVIAVLILALRQPPSTVVANPTEIPATATTAPTVPPVVAAPSVQPIGRVSFSNTTVPGDTASLQIRELRPPASGSSYMVWLTGAEDSAPLRLGRLTVDGLGNGTLTYTDNEGRPLPTLYSQLIVTTETDAEAASPSENVVISGSVPNTVAATLSELLVASENGISGGSLYDGLLAEARIASQHAGLAAGATTTAALRLHAEHTINILQGTRDDYDGSGAGQNPGRGVGVGPLLDVIDSQLASIASSATNNIALQSQIELLRVCTQNTRQRMNRVVALETTMLAGESPEAVNAQATESAAVATEIVSGIDLNDNGQIEPFEGECGIEQIPTYSVLIGNIDLFPGPLPEPTT
jgi:tRNA A-37 threonylcarbamoyl transferase component Bud32